MCIRDRGTPELRLDLVVGVRAPLRVAGEEVSLGLEALHQRLDLFGRRVWLLAGCRRGYPADHVQHRRALGLARRRERVELRLEARVLLAQLVQLAAHLPPAPIASPRLG